MNRDNAAVTVLRNEDVAEIVAEIPEGHRHLRTTVRLADGSAVTFQEATVAALVRAYVAVKTDPLSTRVALAGRRVADRKEGYAEWQLLEAPEPATPPPHATADPACDFYCGQILSGRQSVPVYCESDRVFAFHHTNPIWEHHVVLLPKQHVASLLALEEEDNDLLLELMRTAKRIAADFMARCGGARVYTNLGDYQSSKHLHWHIGCGRQLRPY